MGDATGSIKKLVLDGVTYDVPGDTNISEMGGAFESEGIPTSGRTMIKMTRRAETRDGVVVGCNGAERELLQELSERTTPFTMAYTTAGGDIYRADGNINFENRETEESKATLQLIPVGKWNAFLAT